MGFSISFSKAWQRHDDQIRREGGVAREGLDRVPLTAQEVRAGDDERDPERVVKSRLRQQDVAVGIDSDRAHHGGEEVTIIYDGPEIVGGRPTGDLVQEYVVWGTDDKPRTYRKYWRKTSEGSHVAERSRRIFT